MSMFISHTTTTGNYSKDFVGSNANVLLLCFQSKQSGQTAPTFNGVNFTYYGQVGSVYSGITYLWYMSNPPSGSHAFIPNNGSELCDVVTLKNVNLTNPFGNVVYNLNTVVGNLSIYSQRGESEILVYARGSSGTASITGTSNQYSLYNFGVGAIGFQATIYPVIYYMPVTWSYSNGQQPYDAFGLEIFPLQTNLNSSVANSQNRYVGQKYQSKFNVSQSVRVSNSASRIAVWLGTGKYYAIMFSTSVGNSVGRLAKWTSRIIYDWTSQTKTTDNWTNQSKSGQIKNY